MRGREKGGREREREKVEREGGEKGERKRDKRGGEREEPFGEMQLHQKNDRGRQRVQHRSEVGLQNDATFL